MRGKDTRAVQRARSCRAAQGELNELGEDWFKTESGSCFSQQMLGGGRPKEEVPAGSGGAGTSSWTASHREGGEGRVISPGSVQIQAGWSLELQVLWKVSHK